MSRRGKSLMNGMLGSYQGMAVYPSAQLGVSGGPPDHKPSDYEEAQQIIASEEFEAYRLIIKLMPKSWLIAVSRVAAGELKDRETAEREANPPQYPGGAIGASAGAFNPNVWSQQVLGAFNQNALLGAAARLGAAAKLSAVEHRMRQEAANKRLEQLAAMSEADRTAALEKLLDAYEQSVALAVNPAVVVDLGSEVVMTPPDEGFFKRTARMLGLNKNDE